MNGELVPRSALGDAELDAMYQLFETHFDNVSEQRFRADLGEKQWIVRIRAGGTLFGFTSLKYLCTEHAGTVLKVLYSGDTIVAPAARFSTVFARSWIQAVRRLSAYYDASDMRWLLLVSGFRTYRFLPVFWKTFLPSCTDDAPPLEHERMRTVARATFGSRYDAAAGIVRFAEPQICRADAEGIAAHRLGNPHVKFFVACNPGYARGDELVCWTRLSPENLTPAGLRMWRAGDARLPLSLAG